MSDVQHAQKILSFAEREASGLGVTFAVDASGGLCGRDGFVIERAGGGWRVRGANARSCLFGVYHLQAGGGAGGFRPRFSVRGLNVCETLVRHTPAQVERLIDRAARWRMNRLIVHHAYGYRRHAALIDRCCAERGIELMHYLQSSVLFLDEASVDLFARDEAGRPRTPHLENETRLCPNHPGAREQLARGARAYLASDAVPAGGRVIVIDADGYLFCRCPACRGRAPVEQWAPLFELIQDAAEATGKRLSVHYLAYVWRYSLPTHKRLLSRLGGVLFDTHQRLRWRPIGAPHELTHYNELESQGDRRAATTPLNVYLKERLAEWRRAVSGEATVFENLMLHGSISCPQPYTPQLLSDLETYRDLGVDGVIYEAFEPGIESFTQQLGVLSRAMWEDAESYTPTALERACSALTEADAGIFDFKNCFNSTTANGSGSSSSQSCSLSTVKNARVCGSSIASTNDGTTARDKLNAMYIQSKRSRCAITCSSTPRSSACVRRLRNRRSRARYSASTASS